MAGEVSEEVGGDVGFEPVVSAVVDGDAVGFEEGAGVGDVAVGVNGDGDGFAVVEGRVADGVEYGGCAAGDALGDGVEGRLEVGESLWGLVAED